MSSSGKLVCKSKCVSLFHNFGNEYQSWPHKHGVLWALFQHCSCVTSPRAGFSVPGPSLNISHCRLLLGSLQEKGNHNKLCSATSPYFPLPSLSLTLSFSTYVSLYPCLSILTHTVSLFFSQCPTLDSISLLPLLPSSQSEW